MAKQQIKTGYKITTDPLFQNKRLGITPVLQKQLEPLFFEVQNKSNSKIIDKLTHLIVEYPTVPLLKNYLSVAYNVRGNHDEAMEVNKWILADHPDYLFGKLNKANSCIENSDFDAVPDILGPALEISQLYPDRDTFHLAEITNFFKVIIRYYVAIGNKEMAEQRLKELKKLAPDEQDTEDAEEYVFKLRLLKATEHFVREKETTITPTIQKELPLSEVVEAPQFNHREILALYQSGIDIPHEQLEKIITLPRKQLIEDLEMLLSDAVNRYDYFNKMGWEEETHTFVLHSLFLLKEIDAVESLPKIFSFLENTYDFLDFWLGDHKTDTLWQCFYRLGFENTPALKQFLLMPGVDTYCKTAVSEALCQILLHNPERRNEILSVYSDVFTRFSEAASEDSILDSDFLGLSIGDTIDCDLHELLPIIQTLFNKGYVAIGINGTYTDVEQQFKKESSRNHKRNLLTIFELYDYVLSSWAGYNEDNSDSEIFDTVLPIQSVSVKIGRNDPCPCGSGKKYKKCCGTE
ncbi:MAG: DUF1186 domain-containing protein [Bacteroidales bacterium]|nr:DUF1186 domain-containing protein [Bacteroidales bacterium]